MSAPRTQTGAAGSPEFSELWKSVSKVPHNATGERRAAQRSPRGTASVRCNAGLLSPRPRGISRHPGLSAGDSPGDVEASQDIFWDSTSPTQTGSGHKNTIVVEISDIVNRIAPKNIRPKAPESSLLQWAYDGAILCTPETSKPVVRKRSSRRSSVEDLMKLAKQFDRNMQQDQETSEQQSAASRKPAGSANASQTKPVASVSSQPEDPKCPSSSDQAEAELQALFDSSTQAVSGRLSEDSFCSVEQRDPTPPCAPKTCDDFDDDWDNDDFLSDSLILEMTQNPAERPDADVGSKRRENALAFPSLCKAATSRNGSNQPADKQARTSSSVLQQLCPKTKTSNRSTFKLQPNTQPHPHQAKEASTSSFTLLRPKGDAAALKPAAAARSGHVSQERLRSSSNKAPAEFSDTLWDDGDDDALLYQACDTVERVSYSQPKETTPNAFQERGVDDVAGRQKAAELPRVSSVGQHGRSSGGFVRSNSLPATTGGAVRYQGWSISMKAANDRKSGMSQSFPGGRSGLGAFNRCGNLPRSCQAGAEDVDSDPPRVMASDTSVSHHAAFKRSLLDSAIASNKVFVISQTAGKCSAAEIERKKQEALARRRLRQQNAPKP